MGLFSRRIKDPVRGTARVVASSGPPDSASMANCAMSLVIEAEGIPAYPLRHHHLLTPTAKWPWPGTVLPVLVDRGDHDRIRILWDEMPTHEESGMATAEALARRRRGEAPASPAAGDVPPQAADIVGQLQQMFPGATVQVSSSSGAAPADIVGPLEQAMGRDLDGDGRIGVAGAPAPGAGTPPATPPPPAAATPDVEDRLARLERLAALRASGALSEDEFQAEKRRVLGP